jgi:hypothetical protein
MLSLRRSLPREKAFDDIEMPRATMNMILKQDKELNELRRKLGNALTTILQHNNDLRNLSFSESEVIAKIEECKSLQSDRERWADQLMVREYQLWAKFWSA